MLEHLFQKTIWPLQIGGLDVSVTNGVITLWLSVITVFWLFLAVSRNLQMVPGRFQNLVEVVVLFIRDEVGNQIEHHRAKWLPFLIAIFFFILFNNLWCLVPNVSGVTANLNTTAALALIVFGVVQFAGISEKGVSGYLKSILPPGLPWPMMIFLAPIELISQLAKPFSLALRLFANMFAGHALMLMFISLIFVFKSYLVAPAPLLGDVVFLLFEIFVAFIQAFIFTYLSALYIETAQAGH